VRSFVFSFQTKLVLSLGAVIVLAIFAAGAVFVIETRDERRQQALDRVAAATPAIYQHTLFALIPREGEEREFSEILDDLAAEQQVRILIVSGAGLVLHDTSETLTGSTMEIPESTLQDLERGFIAWEPPASFAERDVTFVTASTRFVAVPRQTPLRVVMAVESDTVAGAWLEMLPSLTLAALIAVPLASIAAVVLARQVANPVRRLTAASEAMAGGDFSQRVDVGRDDEVGRLARAFTIMAERVGERDAQMRALLANVSHDLKTPMTSITGYAQALEDGTATGDDAGRIGGIIAEEAQHVNGMLEDLLYLGEIDAGQVITRSEDVPLSALVSRCVRRIEPAAAVRSIDVEVDIEPGTTLRRVDPEKLERALTNVLDNAAKFTPNGGRISVAGRHENGAGPKRIVCAVTNSGSSIPPDDLPRLFDRFFRGDRARHTASGSGLGLAISRELVELNRGTISAANEPPGSVTVTMALPA
jgi:signal transduction histidine kinase